MRIISDDAENYIKRLAASISRDPASMDAWRCLHLAACKGSEPVSQLTIHTLKTEFKHGDCDVVFCQDNDVLIIGKASQMDMLEKVQSCLLQDMDEAKKPDLHMYDLFFGWRDIRSLLLDKVGSGAAPKLDEKDEPIGDVSALTGIFEDARRKRKSRHPLHILLVEDDEMTRRLVVNLFKENYAIFTAKNAQEAIADYMLHAPDIVFLDINLPDHDGFQVLKKIIKSDPEAYVVMFSGNSYLDNVTHALGEGASGFISKPFSREKMIRYIEDCDFGRQG